MNGDDITLTALSDGTVTHLSNIENFQFAGVSYDIPGLVASSRSGMLTEVPIAGFHISRQLWLIRPSAAKILPHQARFCDLLEDRDWLPEALGGQALSRVTSQGPRN